ncbi:2-oxoglutarate dehydrogenase E1 component [Nemorincola caseinilytica]|uniref:oxoglutarate dehydrogenase (succinyl-transferring) n=1 Tax=Nemorincola caseinilytica TaxID=2054315 RepID=A0ABP8NQP9_9BACT
MKDLSFVIGPTPEYIESLYRDFAKDSTTVDPEWKKFFEGFDFAVNNDLAKTPAEAGKAAVSSTHLEKELGVFELIRAYRKRGHLMATTNPIRTRKDRHAQLELANFGLSDSDMETGFFAGKAIGLKDGKLKEIVARLKELYASNVGVEYTYINDTEKCQWVQKTYENLMRTPLNTGQRRRILEKLNEGVIFEKFLNTKFIGQKRFGLEGGEATIAALDNIINGAAEAGVQEVVIGMAHRGRLNILANILRKTYEQIFSEFEGNMPEDMTMGSGDVKYHLGFHSDITTPGNKAINVQLAPNPSHLEAVDPVVLGFARAKADTLYDREYDKVLPILIHGDAAVAGQGIIYELLQMSKLEGYHTGGTIHYVINNQIGFTTDFDDARSSDYCTSIASMLQCPVLHVNGDDAEAVVKCAMLALEYRQKYNEDIFIDMVCYRKHGHNEGDEPKFTQPQLYALIEKHQNPREIYMQYLMEHGDAEAKELAKEMETRFWNDLQARLDEVKQKPLPYKYQKPEMWWKELRKAKATDLERSPDTAITTDQFKQYFSSLMQWPSDFSPLRKVEKLLQDKIKLFETDGKVDWATGELLAYASLLASGNEIRLSGEDVKRGTFSHRHAVIYDQNSNKPYNRLSRLQKEQGTPYIYNSLLSEYAVLGFEYGYAMANPHNLVLWEAQYGDFANGAQITIDQYIASAEQKWTAMNGLVMLLPHGYEGGGPEHSSARLERFLQNCAELNMIVTNITTAANFFHALRRQMSWEFRKPLINFSPKANLRHARSYSSMEEFTTGGFREVIDDPNVKSAAKVKRVLLCTGKMYFDLSEKQLADKREDVAVVRLEQLYPLPIAQLREIRARYKKAEWVWVQEEPQNMGAYWYLYMHAGAEGFDMRYISRQASASPATGFAKKHAIEQADLVEQAFAK